MLTFTPDKEAVQALRASWGWLLDKPYKPVLFSVLGDAFVQLESGAIQWLNTGTGEVAQVAESMERFRELLGTEQANEWFLPPLVEKLHAAGKVPAAGECYTYVTLPVFEEGKYEVANLNPVPAKEHFALTGHVHHEIQSLPSGAKVRINVAP
ncbi:MAG: DUF1851 domain-containing protein [Simplicispira suum]|uniref:T6SS immunity protein Tdi1 domain-containing protein n=1 Tax=Simplicispira suum TaxID=2109915 RepID=UPI001C6BC967|nr:T6SS immunity protein Tdi1 domain-containing protein [Simplicispira suum]MBW7831839.1 DUF1851 domain-containing protein [Simplicispira suum]